MSLPCEQLLEELTGTIASSLEITTQHAVVKLRTGTCATLEFVYSPCQLVILVIFGDIKSPAERRKTRRRRTSIEGFPVSRQNLYKKKMGVRTITTFSKDPCKAVCHPVDIFQKKTSVFRPHFQTRIFFSCFNPAVIQSEALWHSQRGQLNTFLSHDAIWMTKPLVIRMSDGTTLRCLIT